MTEIMYYYPLIDCDTEGTEKLAMIPTPNGNAVKSRSKMWIEQMIPYYFRLHTKNSSSVDTFRIRCPRCGKILDRIGGRSTKPNWDCMHAVPAPKIKEDTTMKTYLELTPYIKSKDYEIHLWNALRGRHSSREVLVSGLNLSGNAHALPSAAHDKYMAALKKESLFRNLATEIHAYDTDYRIKTVQNEGVSAWVPEGSAVTVTDDMSDFGEISLDCHKFATHFTLENSFVQDNSFMIEKYLVSRLAQNFGRAEDDAFFNGTGVNMPTGILAENGGADVGASCRGYSPENLCEFSHEAPRRFPLWKDVEIRPALPGRKGEQYGDMNTKAKPSGIAEMQIGDTLLP